jgi:hypothetical protein
VLPDCYHLLCYVEQGIPILSWSVARKIKKIRGGEIVSKMQSP